MCTHISFRNDGGHFIAARTMDFSFEIDPIMAVVPRNYPIKLAYHDNVLEEHYAFLGLSRYSGDEYIFADGVNEWGLSCATLYFTDYSSYSKEENKDKEVNLTPQEVVFWILAKARNLDDVKAEFDKIHLIEEDLDFIGATPPLHWVVCDKEGNSLTIEPIDGEFQIRVNKFGLYTNSPEISWHETNLRQYTGLSSFAHETRVLNDYTIKPWGMSSGGFGIPGDYTSPSRYVRAAFNKFTVEKGQTKIDAITAAMKVLDTVSIPLGSVISPQGRKSYTQYSAYMLHENSEYYYKTYKHTGLVRFGLFEYDLDGKDVIVNDVDQNLHIIEGKTN